MSAKIGHFEILSELSKSATGAVYKANDPQTSQTVALKAIQLSAFGDSAAELKECLLAEAEATKQLSHSNLIAVRDAGEIEGQFCAAMEYIQGNSIATMLARKEGFSIWDLLDIGRQVASGLDHAGSLKVFHYNLEPAKIMCGWDGGVRVLGYGISSVGQFSAQMPDLPAILYYMSPEQIRGEVIDARSNLFSLGAIFYEMVTDCKAFPAEDAESLRQAILEGAPLPPIQINAKLQPALSDLILKALAKNPAERYQSGRELLDDLEKCKETKSQTAKTAPAKGTMVPDAVKAANQAKFIGASAAQTAKPAAPATPTRTVAATAQTRPSAAATAPAPARVTAQKPQTSAPVQNRPVPAVEKKVAAPAPPPQRAAATAPAAGRTISPAKPPSYTAAPPSPSMSSAVVEEPAVEAPQFQSPLDAAPKIAVDPMMAQEASSGGPGAGISFSDMTELPPLKEAYSAPPPPPPAFEQPVAQSPGATPFRQEPEKPKIQPRQVAEKAVKEIKSVPPRLIVYSIAGAAVLILAIAVWLVFHIQSLNSDGDSSRPAATEQQQNQPAPQPAPQPQQVQAQTPPPSVAPTEPDQPVAEDQPAPAPVVAAPARGRNARKKSSAPAAAAVAPGQMAIDSTPQGAQVQIDGRTDPSWVTPFTLSGLTPGQHSVTVTKSGYVADTRTVQVISGSRAFVSTHLNQLAATLAVSSTPAGANIYIDGKDTGKLTPAQVSVATTGSHIVLVRKSGYIDETTSAQFALGQTVSFTPTLRELGNVDDIRTTGRMKKLFGKKEAQNMGTVSIKTNPKGAQVAINQHMLDKDSPVEVMLDPGNYIVDITMSGYQPIHKVISVDRGGKAVMDEVMQHE